MAKVELTPAPALRPGARYADYKEWLLENFFDHLCSYCLLHNTYLEIDHYVPKAYAPAAEHDPGNLLLACGHCNKRKGDYHPRHAKRTRARDHRLGHLVADVRTDDFARLFALQSDGQMDSGVDQRDRGRWNVVFFRWDSPKFATERNELRKLLRLAEKSLRRHRRRPEDELVGTVVAELVGFLARRLVFYDAFGLQLSADLRALVTSFRDELRAVADQ